MKLNASTSNELGAARPDPDEDEEMLDEELGGDEAMDDTMDEDEEIEDDADGSPTR